jgi:hypothetical protein
LAVAGRLAATIFVVCCAVVAMFVALALLQFNQIRAELERERIAVLADRIAAPFEAAARIGLPLSSVRNADAVLERARQLDGAIEAIFVLGPQGEVLRSTSAAQVGGTALGFEVAPPPEGGPRWFAETSRGYRSGLWILDASGRAAGGVAVLFSQRQSLIASWAMAGQLVTSALLFALAMGPVIWAMLRLALRGRITEFDRFERHLLAFETKGWRARTIPGASDAATSLGALLGAAEAQYRLGAQGNFGTAPALVVAPPVMEAAAASVTRLRGPVTLVLGTVLACAIGLFSILTIHAFDRAITPELEARTQLIGGLVRSELQRALELGIPIEALGGLTGHLDEILRDFPEIARIAILGSGGDVIADSAREAAAAGAEASRGSGILVVQTGTADLPVLVGSEFAGTIRIEGNPRYFQTRLRDVILDVSVLALAMLLVGLEVTLAMLAVTIWKPHARILALLGEQSRGRFDHIIPEAGPPDWRRFARRLNDRVADLTSAGTPKDAPTARGGLAPPKPLRLSDASDIRLPLFLLAFGTEMTASFLPILAAGTARPDWLPADAAAAAPLVLYLLCVSALTPFAGPLSGRFGANRLFLASMPPIMLALAWMSLADGVAEVALARGAVAAFYALASIAAQEYALRADPAGSTGRIVGAFIGLTLAGTFCGSVTGAVVAGRFGYRTSILAGAAIVIGAALACHWAMRGAAGDPAPRAAPGTAVVAAASAAGRSFAALLLGIAVPASAVTAAFVWYFTPLALSAEGLRAADIGRVVMLYYLAAILVGPMVLPLADRAFAAALCIGGAFLSGVALLFLSAGEGAWVIAGSVAGVGIGHAIIRAPIYALARRLAGGAAGPITLLRLTERLGAVAGVAFAAAMMSRDKAAVIPGTLGMLVVTGLIIFALMTRPRTHRGEG